MAVRYDPRRADQVAIAAARATVWGAGLLERDHDLGVTVEVGAGSGAVLDWARRVGATSVVGVDLLVDRLRDARTVAPMLAAAVADGRSLPVRDGAIDTVICSTVLSSVLDDAVAMAIADDIARALRPGGVVLWFDFFRDNPANANVRGVGRGDLRRWFPGFELELRRVVLAPPVARRLLRWPRVAALLEMAPPLRTHLAGLLIAPP